MASSQDEEYKALTSSLSSFYNYGKWAYQSVIAPRKIKLKTLSEADIQLIPWYPQHIDNLAECLKMNEDFTRNLALSVAGDWGADSNPATWAQAESRDFDKVTSILGQLSREWSDDGDKERSAVFGKIVDEVKSLYPDLKARQNVKVLIPGCGTGRLVFDFVREGFWCQGNELTYHMLLASNFVLNHSFVAHNYSIFPFLHKFSNVLKRTNQIRPVTIPNVNPGEITDLQKENPDIQYTELMSMTAGSFVDLYGPDDLTLITDQYSEDKQAQEFRSANKSSFNVVVTCFFLDTASNILDYIKTIHHTLETGGKWINFGPLLWHFEDDGNITHATKRSGSAEGGEQVANAMKGLELSRDDLIDLVEKMGFRFEKKEVDIRTTYCTDPRSLGGFDWNCVYWVATKI